MKKPILFLSLALISSSVFGQTKSIAHKRHSGSKASFSNTLMHASTFGGPSNLGVAPEKWIRNSELKKVVFINDTLAAMVTEETCRNEYSYQQRETEKWRAGTDTVLRHPVFSSDISVDSMRTILAAEYYFANDMKEVKFENFEQRRIKEKSKVEINKENHTTRRENKKGRNSSGKYTWLALILASSLGIGLIKLR